MTIYFYPFEKLTARLIIDDYRQWTTRDQPMKKL